MNAALAPELLLAPREFLENGATRSRPWTISEAEAYTRWLATHHYENFHVVSFLLPRRLHQDFFNVYAYCRWSDDLGDEIGDTSESLRLLDWWGRELDRMYLGHASHPVFVALQSTVGRHSIPKEPFANLIRAFIQDQTVTRYDSWEAVLDYCVYSANPVGRLLLHLCGYSDAKRQQLSDFTCTALQLANFWQDVSVDLKKNRVYIPLEALDRHGYRLDDLMAQRFCDEFRSVMKECVSRTRDLFERGLPLVGMVDRRLSLDIHLFSRGGLLVLRKIERQDYNVLASRPAVSKTERAALLIQAVARLPFSHAA